MRQVKSAEHLKSKLVPGQTYRRSDLAPFSSNVDKYLAQLVQDGELKKVAYGLYAVPRSTVFGEALPEERSLLQSFLKDDHFVVYSPSQFNLLGLGTTQLYNRVIVFNRKRVGEIELGSRSFYFHRWREAPKELSLEFLAVECVNRLNELAEDREQIVVKMKEKLPQFDQRRLRHAILHYGNSSTQKKFFELMK